MNDVYSEVGISGTDGQTVVWKLFLVHRGKLWLEYEDTDRHSIL